MTKDKALKMSLELIEQLNKDGWVLADFELQMYACINAIKETLTQPIIESCAECGVGDGYALYCVKCSEKYVKRAWVGLNNADMKDERTHNFDFIHGARWAEDKLKEKNVPRKTR